MTKRLTLEGATIIALVGIIPTAMIGHKAAIAHVTVWLMLLLVTLIKNIKKEI